uniref:SFRICE_035687 n=1 Tax=Spodoptera frugiperda TaxID=7108 RepID=A0A2H1X3T1_SPOFR
MAGEVMEDEGHHHALDYHLDHMMTAVMTVEIEDIMLETAHAVVAAGYHWPVRRERTRQCLHFLLSALRSFLPAACTPIELIASVTPLALRTTFTELNSRRVQGFQLNIELIFLFNLKLGGTETKSRTVLKQHRSVKVPSSHALPLATLWIPFPQSQPLSLPF